MSEKFKVGSFTVFMIFRFEYVFCNLYSVIGRPIAGDDDYDVSLTSLACTFHEFIMSDLVQT